MRYSIIRNTIKTMVKKGLKYAITGKYYRKESDGYWRSVKFFTYNDKNLHKVEELHLWFPYGFKPANI